MAILFLRFIAPAAALGLSLLAALVVSPNLAGCSVPQFDPGKLPAAPSVDQLIDANRFRKAIAVLVASPSQSSQYFWQLSRAQLGLGELGPSMDSAEKALAADPKNPAYHVQVAAVAGRTAERASMFKQLSLAKRVKKELDEAIALDPKNPDAIYGLILFSDLAPSFLGGDKEKARSLAEQLTQIAPSRGYLAQATLAHNRKDAAAEETLLYKSVQADPHSYDAHVAFAVFQNKANSVPAERAVEQADEHACQALYIEPERAEAWQILAEQAASAESLREIDGLLAVYRKFNPDDLSPAYHAAVILIAAGRDLDAAQALLQRYLEVPPDGNAPSAGLAHYQLALICEKQGHNDQALSMLRTAVNEDPTLEDARKELKRLDHDHPAKAANPAP